MNSSRGPSLPTSTPRPTTDLAILREEGALWILGSRRSDSFPTRIDGEPRCAVGVVDFDLTTGVVQHVGFRGRATVEKLDRGRARRLLARYLGTDEARSDTRFRESLGDPATVFVRFGPDTAVARDVSYSRMQEESRSEK
jgi:hypothetical protein